LNCPYHHQHFSWVIIESLSTLLAKSRASQTSTGRSWHGTPQALQAAAMMSDLQLDLSELLTVMEHMAVLLSLVG